MFRSFASIMLSAVSLLTAQAIPAFSQSTSETTSGKKDEARSLQACAQATIDQLGQLKIPDTRGLRFQGKVSEATALCRGGEQALQFRGTPWVDWSNYWGTGDMTSLPAGFVISKLPAQRGVAGALVDLELQRVELIKFNLFDNSGTYSQYMKGRNGVSGPALKVWPEMRLQPTNPSYSRRGWRWTAGLQRRPDSLAHRIWNLQRHTKSRNGFIGHVICAERGIRHIFSRSGLERTDTESPRASAFTSGA